DRLRVAVVGGQAARTVPVRSRRGDAARSQRPLHPGRRQQALADRPAGDVAPV
ncbi:MAG: Asparagine synthetase [glutamine-hydrolyzing], partial [uncultured Pseudonocardia sp.]